MKKSIFAIIALFICQVYAFSQYAGYNDRLVNMPYRHTEKSDELGIAYVLASENVSTLRFDSNAPGDIVTADLNESVSTSIEDHTVSSGYRYEFTKNHGRVSVVPGGPCCDNRGGLGYIMVIDTIRFPTTGQKPITLNTPDTSLTWQQIADKYTISELKGILKSLGIKPTGTEGDMARRYKQALSQ